MPLPSPTPTSRNNDRSPYHTHSRRRWSLGVTSQSSGVAAERPLRPSSRRFVPSATGSRIQGPVLVRDFALGESIVQPRSRSLDTRERVFNASATLEIRRLNELHSRPIFRALLARDLHNREPTNSQRPATTLPEAVIFPQNLLSRRRERDDVTQGQLEALFNYTVDVAERDQRDYPTRLGAIREDRHPRTEQEERQLVRVYSIASRICTFFESNEPFSICRQPVFHDPSGHTGYLSFRRLTPVQLAKELRPYLLFFRHAVHLIKSRPTHSTSPPLPAYTRYIAPTEFVYNPQGLPDVHEDYIEACDVTGFYLLCELFWNLIARNKALIASSLQDTHRIGGVRAGRPSRSLRTKFDSVLDIIDETIGEPAVHQLATECEYLTGFNLDDLKDCTNIPPPLTQSAYRLVLKQFAVTPSDHFRAALQQPPKSTWDHLQYLPLSPLDSDPEDPNLSIGLARELGYFDSGKHARTLGLRGGGSLSESSDYPSEEVEQDNMKAITSSPSLSDFTRITEYQEQTPTTFYSAKPVLHLHSPRSKVILQGHNAVSKLSGMLGDERVASNGTEVNGSGPRSDDDSLEQSVEADVFVESSALVLWGASKGLRIEYPSIGIHGVSTLNIDDASYRALYMQLNLYDADNTNSEDDVETADVCIIPCLSANDCPAPDSSGHMTTLAKSNADAVTALYDAVSDCQNLHPDPHEDQDAEDGTQQLALGTAGPPGDGGWITSENMAQFMDSNGNFVGFGGGADDSTSPIVAGTRRPREEQDGESDEVDGDGESKWQRTG